MELTVLQRKFDFIKYLITFETRHQLTRIKYLHMHMTIEK